MLPESYSQQAERGKRTLTYAYQLCLIVAGAVLLLGRPVIGQQPPLRPTSRADTNPGHAASIVGIVFDSLHRKPLAAAEVMVDGASRTSGATDSLGEFRFSGLEAGSYQLGVFHPLLDSLGISLNTAKFYLKPDSVGAVRFAIPSAATLLAAKCPASEYGLSTSAVMGRVANAVTLEPIAGAQVLVTWTRYEVSKDFGVRMVPQTAIDSTNAAGSYTICGLPTPLTAVQRAVRGKQMTSELPISLTDTVPGVAIRSLLLPPPDALLTERSRAAVGGRVIASNGSYLAGVEIELSGTGLKTTTDVSGNFALASLPSGSRVLTLRQLGYDPQDVAVDLSPQRPLYLTIQLGKRGVLLDPVVVSARPGGSLEAVGFSERMKTGTGKYITADEIARTSATQFTDLLRKIPGITVGYDKYGNVRVSSARAGGSSLNDTHGCVQYVVNGVPWGSPTLRTTGATVNRQVTEILDEVQDKRARDINSSLRKTDILGIEVYQGPSTPLQFKADAGNCAVVMVWTR
ncbi:MAG TPA: carboxypeptidase regulatory-like domain-containing protein [Gemmatimonadaceae bacterium]|nr:carboxypeptidase regulatory-like domain-containing protein [Gemmatimonadaceae bacterium]